MFGGIDNWDSTAQRLQSAGFMRVVIMEPDSEIRRILRHSIVGQPDFQLVGESRCGSECATLLAAYLPELLITRIEHSATTLVPSEPFPVRIELRPLELAAVRHEAFETMDIPLDDEKLRDALSRARTEIYRRKLDELTCLLHSYMSYSRHDDKPTKSSQFQIGCDQDLPAEDVTFIAADGNYMKVHASGHIHDFRDTMAAVSSRLDPSIFCRVHRSFIVNRVHVTNVLRKDGAAVALELSDGSEIPVGPNYRSEVERLVIASRRLSA